MQETVQTDELKTYVSYLAKSAARLEKFASDAILISELTVGSYQTYESEFDLLKLIGELELQLEEELIQKNIRIAASPVGSTTIHSDRNLLAIAMRHVLENAVKFAPEGSVISISSRDNDNMVSQITVEDCGEGFSPSALENLFGLFAIGQDHIDNACGLGMALTNMIMHTLGGRISVSNRREGGAAVNLFL